MPNTIITFTDSKNDKIALFDDGTTTVGGKPTGKWSSNTQPDKNILSYPVTGGTSRTIPIKYTLNKNNQLGLTIGTGNASNLNGRILLEGHKGILYRLVDDDWLDIDGSAFYVYGSVVIDPVKDTLTVTDGAGVAVVVTGAPSSDGNMHSAVSAGPGTSDPGSATVSDLLTFNAETTNKDSDGNTFTKDAVLDLNGAWDLKNGQVVFNAKLTGSSAPTHIEVALIGQLKGVAVGFQFTETGNDAHVLFTIAGKIKGQNSVGGWDFTLGYAQNHFSAELNVNAAPASGTNGFTIKGSLKVAGGGGAPISISLALDVAYVFNGGTLQVNVTGAGQTYSLQLSGKLNIAKNWNAEFAISYSTSGGLKSFSLTLGNAQAGALNKALSVYVSGTGTTLKASLSLNLTWVGGVIVPSV